MAARHDHGYAAPCPTAMLASRGITPIPLLYVSGSLVSERAPGIRFVRLRPLVCRRSRVGAPSPGCLASGLPHLGGAAEELIADQIETVRLGPLRTIGRQGRAGSPPSSMGCCPILRPQWAAPPTRVVLVGFNVSEPRRFLGVVGAGHRPGTQEQHGSAGFPAPVYDHRSDPDRHVTIIDQTRRRLDAGEELVYEHQFGSINESRGITVSSRRTNPTWRSSLGKIHESSGRSAG